MFPEPLHENDQQQRLPKKLILARPGSFTALIEETEELGLPVSFEDKK